MTEPQKSVVGKMIVRGVEYKVFLDVSAPTRWTPQGSGRFAMVVSGKDISADTWEELYKRAMTVSKEAAVKVNVPLLKFERQVHSWSAPTSFKPVTLTGKHQKNGNFLIRYGVRNGKDVTEQTDRYRQNDDFYLPMSKEEMAEGLRLMEADRKAGEALAKWKHAHEASLDKLYDAAEQEAMEKLDREEGRS